MKNWTRLTAVTFFSLLASSLAFADTFELLTGVAPGTSPGSVRVVFSTGGFLAPGLFVDGQRLAGTSEAFPAPYLGSGTPIFSPNQFGSLSFVIRRGSIPAGPPPNQIPVLSIDYLGGPLLDLDGDLNDGSRSLIPLVGQGAVVIPDSQSFLDLTIGGSSISLNAFDASSSNPGSTGLTAEQLISVQTLAGTSINGVPGPAINPGIDTRQGTLTAFAAGVTRIDDLGYEIWSDSIDENSSSADLLGTAQNLGTFGGWLIERDSNGNFPTLTGLGLGSTVWDAVHSAQIGNTFNTIMPFPFDQATIIGGIGDNNGDGVPDDDFAAPGNGGLALAEFGGDLGAYFDSVVIPVIHPLAEKFVYLESAGFGINNSFDPVFHDSVGYDLVIVAQSAPEVFVDIKPGSCPNSFNRNSRGVLPVALLGNNALDVTQVDLASVMLTRADGLGGSVGPHEGPPGPRSRIADVGTPFDGQSCDCHQATTDGAMDLSMKFATDEVVASLELDGLTPGDLVELTLSGTLLDGTPFSGSDCIRLVPPGTPPGRLSVNAGQASRWIDIAPLDLQLDGGGFGLFDRTYPLTSVVTLTAPATTTDGQSFLYWRVDGVRQTMGVRILDLTIIDGEVDARAVYGLGTLDPRPKRQGLSDRL